MSTVVFDADDTLWMNEWQYSQAFAEFYAYLYRIATWRTPNFHYVNARFFAIDGGQFATWGIRRGRVADSMVKTYREVCDWIAWRHGDNLHSDEHERRIREIGDMPFDYGKLRWLAGAEDALTTLAGRGHTLCLLTSYDDTVFPDKADHLQVSRFFTPDRIRVLPGKKTAQDFTLVSGDTDPVVHPARCYAIGNGESDILPALTLGHHWHGVCIPHGSTSKYLEDKGAQDSPVPPPLNYFMPPVIEHPRVTTIRRISEVADLIG